MEDEDMLDAVSRSPSPEIDRHFVNLIGAFEAVLEDVLDHQPRLHVNRRLMFADPNRKVVVVNRDFAAKLLESDNAYRMRQEWPLLTYPDVVKIDKTYRFELDRTSLFVETGKSNVDAPEFSQTEEQIITALKSEFPMLAEILKFSPETMVVAGGAMTDSVQWCNHRYHETAKDCDIFFHNTTVEEASAIVQKIVRFWLDPYTPKDQMRQAYSNGKCTTLICSGEQSQIYQLIHRVYPNKSAIIGGFDMSPCAILWDGDQILMTPMAAFSIASCAFIPDVSRQSTSFSQRILKYGNKGFTLLLPCKTEAEIRQNMFDNVTDSSEISYVTIGGSVKLRVTSTAMELSTRVTSNVYDTTGDYDNGQTITTTNIRLLNTIMAARGNIDGIVWGGVTYEDVYLDHKIPIMTSSQINKYLITGLRRYRQQGWYGLLYRWFGRTFIESTLKRNPHAFFEKNKTQLCATVERTYEATKQIAGRSLWLGPNDNPSRQRFTASFNPVDTTVEWYRPQIARPLRIGIPLEVCATLLRGTQEPNCLFSTLNKDAFRYLMRILRHLIAESPMLSLLEAVPQ